MALAEVLQRRVQLRKNESFGEEEDMESGSNSDRSNLDLEESVCLVEEDARVVPEYVDGIGPESPASSASHLLTEPVSEISFGALVAAQATLGKFKRSSSPRTPASLKRVHTSSNGSFPEAVERCAGKKDYRVLPRTSKHAPAELSSKKAVSRKREIVTVKRREIRDPRFEALSGPLNEEKVRKNYSFLADYEASEMKNLKDTIRTTHDAATLETLKRALLSMESRQKTQQTKDLQQEIIREHRKKERDLIKQGKKPFYLKQGEQKKLALVKRFEAIGEKKAAKVIERRRKKKAVKERKTMPNGRRIVEAV